MNPAALLNRYAAVPDKLEDTPQWRSKLVVTSFKPFMNVAAERDFIEYQSSCGLDLCQTSVCHKVI